MAIPGLFVEYLVNGAVALVWAYPLLLSAGITKIENPLLPLYALGLYVLGMMIDFVAWIVTRPVKRFLRRRIAQSYKADVDQQPGSSTGRQVKFSIYAPELARENAMRSSRDRIARGSFINAILATIIVLPLTIGIPISIFTFAMWWGFESVSYKFELKAEQAIKGKLS
ncbi:hypothetical protein FBQ87_11515 [Sphingobacteriales bacterium CHB3]|nr:hypothetical protein [Sphingobacteriales bacterium CHB3]